MLSCSVHTRLETNQSSLHLFLSIYLQEARAAAPPKVINHANTRIKPSSEGTGVFTPMSTGVSTGRDSVLDAPSPSRIPAEEGGVLVGVPGEVIGGQIGGQARGVQQRSDLHRLVRTPQIEPGVAGYVLHLIHPHTSPHTLSTPHTDTRAYS